MHRLTAVIAGLSLAFFGTSSTIATTINVPVDYSTIQDAIDASADGDVIQIAPGTYHEHTLNPGGKAITIQGALNGDGSLATTIDAQQAGSVFVLISEEADTTVIRDLVITGGTGFNVIGNGSIGGGGICCGLTSTPTIVGCTVTGNEAWFGGGIFTAGPVSINDCKITNNEAISGGGIYCLASMSTINGCTIEGNVATSEGGGLHGYAGGEWTISGCTIVGNTAVDNGGGIRCSLSIANISDSTISGNSAGDGGGIFTTTTTTISDCTISENTAGGGIRSYSSHLITILSTNICGNASDQIWGNNWTDGGGNCVQDSCDDCGAAPCPADYDGNGVIEGPDLTQLLGAWNTTNEELDLTGDGLINGPDLTVLLGGWGACGG